jgi:hypothetical protein
MTLVKTALAIAVALALSTSASAVIIPLSAAMDGPQANAGAGTGSPGTGTANITLDTASNVLSWNISWSGLIGAPTLMHFHGPALPNQNAGVQVSTGVAGPPVVGNAVLNALQEADILAGLWYLNLHTTAFGGGEIRGQVLPVPEPGTLVLLAGGMGLIAVVRRSVRS